MRMLYGRFREAKKAKNENRLKKGKEKLEKEKKKL